MTLPVIDLLATLSEDRKQLRLDICNACEHKIAITNMCGKCGCFLPWKTSLAVASCPISKWTNELFENIQQ